MIKLRNLGVLLALVAAILGARAEAHPHSWIDVRSTVLFDAEGSVRGLHIDWIFDEFYSAFVLQDIVRAGEDTKQALAALTQENLKGLRDFKYFTEIRADGIDVVTDPAVDGEMSVYKDRLRMTFTIPFSAVVDPRAAVLEYAVYDPTYYIEILHTKRSAVTLAGPGSDTCDVAMIEPTPDPASISLAASLGQTEIGPDNLGQLFAEIITVSCN